MWLEKFCLDTLLYQRDLFPMEFISTEKVTKQLEEPWHDILPLLICDQLLIPSELDWYCAQAKKLFHDLPWMTSQNIYRIAHALRGIGYAAGRHSNFPYYLLDESLISLTFK